MPLEYGIENDKHWVRWGAHGKKYFYIYGNKQSRDLAKKKALEQANAIYASGYKE